MFTIKTYLFKTRLSRNKRCPKHKANLQDQLTNREHPNINMGNACPEICSYKIWADLYKPSKVFPYEDIPGSLAVVSSNWWSSRAHSMRIFVAWRKKSSAYLQQGKTDPFDTGAPTLDPEVLKRVCSKRFRTTPSCRKTLGDSTIAVCSQSKRSIVLMYVFHRTAMKS